MFFETQDLQFKILSLDSIFIIYLLKFRKLPLGFAASLVEELEHMRKLNYSYSCLISELILGLMS